MATTQKVKLSELVLDFSVYPRTQLSNYNTASIAEALSAGAELPPIIAEEKSKRIVDGFHRHHALMRVFGEDAVIDVVFKRYKDDADLFADAMRRNATHGQKLSKFDRLRCVIKSEELGLSVDAAIKALGMTREALGDLKANRIGKLTGPRTGETPGVETAVPLKRTIEHMSGQQLTQGQVDANLKLGGMDQLFYINQLILLLREGLIDTDNRSVMAGLDELERLLEARKTKAAA